MEPVPTEELRKYQNDALFFKYWWHNSGNKCWFNSMAACIFLTPGLRALLQHRRTLPYTTSFWDGTPGEKDEVYVDLSKMPIEQNPDIANVDWAAPGMHEVQQLLHAWVDAYMAAMEYGPCSTCPDADEGWEEMAHSMGQALKAMNAMDRIARWEPLFNVLPLTELRSGKVTCKSKFSNVMRQDRKGRWSLPLTSPDFLGSTAADVLLRGIARTSCFTMDLHVTVATARADVKKRIIVQTKFSMDNIHWKLQHQDLVCMSQSGHRKHPVSTLPYKEMLTYAGARLGDIPEGEEGVEDMRALFNIVRESDRSKTFRTQHQSWLFFFGRPFNQRRQTPMPVLVSHFEVFHEKKGGTRIPLPRNWVRVPVHDPSILHMLPWRRCSRDTSEWTAPARTVATSGKDTRAEVDEYLEKFAAKCMGHATYTVATVQICQKGHYTCWVPSAEKGKDGGWDVVDDLDPGKITWHATLPKLRRGEGATFFWQLTSFH